MSSVPIIGQVEVPQPQRQQLQVAPIPPGSVLVLSGLHVHADSIEQLVGEIKRVAGHELFVLLVAEHGNVEVMGPGVDWADKVLELRQAALDEALAP